MSGLRSVWIVERASYGSCEILGVYITLDAALAANQKTGDKWADYLVIMGSVRSGAIQITKHMIEQ